MQPVVLRIGSTWGPLMDPESPFNVVPPLISAVLRGERPAPLYADDGGDFCYAPDAGHAIAALTTAGEPARHLQRVRRATHDQPRTRRRHSRRGPRCRVPLLDGRRDGPGADPYLDISRLTAATGFTPAFDPAAAVADYIAWRTHHDR